MLTRRFFVQDNEPSSLNRLTSGPALDPRASDERKLAFGEPRADVNDALDAHPPLIPSINDVPLTNRDISEMFTSGDYAHASPGLAEKVRQLTPHPMSEGWVRLIYEKMLHALCEGICRLVVITSRIGAS